MVAAANRFARIMTKKLATARASASLLYPRFLDRRVSASASAIPSVLATETRAPSLYAGYPLC